MSKELEYLREDYQNAKNIVEANNKILEGLLQEPLVRLYRETYIQNEEEKTKLETLGTSLAIQEMMECEHIFVRTEKTSESIYHCLKCGLTNEYEVKRVNPITLSTTEHNMSYIFYKTRKNGIVLNERCIYPLEFAKEIYEQIQNNIKTLSNEELKMYFLVVLSKNNPTYYNDLTYEIKRLAGLDINDEPNTMQRIELRLLDIPVIEEGITCYALSDFSKDLFEFVRTIKKRARVEFVSIDEISKYPEIVSEELEKLSDKTNQTKFDVTAIPNPRAYVISPDKLKEFQNFKPNPKVIKRNEELSKKFKINNLTQKEEPKKRVKTKSE